MKLLEYVSINYPFIIDEYERYLERDILPCIGETVTTLRGGFGSLKGGRTLIVKEIDMQYITLTDGDNDYLSTKEDWYKDIKRKDGIRKSLTSD